VPVKAFSCFLVFALLLTACAPQNADEPEKPPFDESSINNVWHKAKLRGVAFRAIGQEPGWLLEITDGTEIMLSTDYGQNVNSYAYVDPIIYQEQRRTLYVIDEENIEIEIRGEACQDVMKTGRLEWISNVVGARPDGRVSLRRSTDMLVIGAD